LLLFLQAQTDGILWSVDRVTFRDIIVEAQRKRQQQFSTFLESVPALGSSRTVLPWSVIMPDSFSLFFSPLC
jgi:hypothetical protein